MSIISEKEVRSFEEKLYELENKINKFNTNVSRCNLTGILDLSHKIETDIESLDKELSGFVRFESTSVEEIRNIRLEDNLTNVKVKYNNGKVTLENECECRRR